MFLVSYSWTWSRLGNLLSFSKIFGPYADRHRKNEVSCSFPHPVMAETGITVGYNIQPLSYCTHNKTYEYSRELTHR